MLLKTLKVKMLPMEKFALNKTNKAFGRIVELLRMKNIIEKTKDHLDNIYTTYDCESFHILHIEETFEKEENLVKIIKFRLRKYDMEKSEMINDILSDHLYMRELHRLEESRAYPDY